MNGVADLGLKVVRLSPPSKNAFPNIWKGVFLVSEIYTFVSESLLKGRYIDISKLDTLPDG